MLTFTKKNFFSYNNLINLFFSFIPLSIILGNLATNINILIICFLGLLKYGKNVFFIDNKLCQYLIYFFFIYLIFITSINNLSLITTDEIYKTHLIKSFFYLRFLLFFLITTKLIEENNFNIKLFITSCAFFSLIVSIDIIIQFIFKKNILGYKISNNRPSSFFNEENIAGGFLQRFILFFFIYVITIKKDKKNINLITILLFLIFLIPILLTSNRMPAIIFVMIFFMYLIIQKQAKYLIVGFALSTLIIFSIFNIKVKDRIHADYKTFFYQSVEIFTKAPRIFLYNEEGAIEGNGPGYLVLFNSGIQIWKKNKLTGTGLKSFRLNCSYTFNQTCSTHPHNYIIELLVDVGLIGLLTIYLLFIIGFFNFIKYYPNEKEFNAKFILFVFFILNFFEFFPFRSSGSFFTTSNSIFIFLIFAIFLNIKNYKIKE